MKKSISGYTLKNTNDYIASLKNQIDVITSKLATLTMELNSANEEISYLKETSEHPCGASDEKNKLVETIGELEKENVTLKERFARLSEDKERQIADLKKESSELLKQLASCREMLRLSGKKHIPEIYDDKHKPSSGGNDIIDSSDTEKKQKIYGEISTQIEKYVAAVEDANNRMKSVMNDVRKDYAAIVEELSKSMNKMLEGLWVVDAYNKRLQNDMLPAEIIALDLKKKVLDMLEDGVPSLVKSTVSVSYDNLSSDERDIQENILTRVSPDSADVKNIRTGQAEPEETGGSMRQPRGEHIREYPQHETVFRINTKIRPIDVFGK